MLQPARQRRTSPQVASLPSAQPDEQHPGQAPWMPIFSSWALEGGFDSDVRDAESGSRRAFRHGVSWIAKG